MTEAEHKANALFAMIFSTSIFAWLGKKGLFTHEDGIEVVEYALLNLETQRQSFEKDAATIDRVRWMLEQIRESLGPLEQ